MANRLDHRQAHEQRPGDGGRGVGLLRQRSQSGGDRPALAERRAHAADADGDAGGGDRYDCDESAAIHGESFLSLMLRLQIFGSGLACTTASVSVRGWRPRCKPRPEC